MSQDFILCTLAITIIIICIIIATCKIIKYFLELYEVHKILKFMKKESLNKKDKISNFIDLKSKNKYKEDIK